MSSVITLDKIFKIDIDFSKVYIIDDNHHNFNNKTLLDTSTRVFSNQQYNNLYIIEQKVSYLIPLPEEYHNKTCFIKNLIGETGILLQVLDEYILLYNTNENLIFLNKGIDICRIYKLDEVLKWLF